MSHVELVAQVADAPHRGQADGRRSPSPTPWWRDAVIYQIYPRSFADGNGDGTGDIAGVRRRLPYLEELGIDAIWFTPWYPSPLADGGYDVADYRAIDPAFGTLEEAERLIVEARALGIRTIVDIVPNHVSSSIRGSSRRSPRARLRAARALLVPPGQGERGEEKPNDWLSSFGATRGRAQWTATARPGSGTCTCSRPSSPT